MTNSFPKLVHSLDIGNGRLRRLVEKSTSQLEFLPLVHSTDSYNLSGILESKKVIPQGCDVFTGEMIVYLFYGKPAFRPNLDEQPTGLKHFAPICLIFKRDFYPDIKRLFPFDSGAFSRGMYERFMHAKMRLGDFLLEPDARTPSKIISLFFGSNEAYVGGKCEKSISIDAADFEAEAYHGVLTSKDSNVLDSRGTAIEVQVEKEFSIEGIIDAIILPSVFLDGRVGESLGALKISPLGYRLHDRFRPNEYTSTIQDMCIGYYMQRKFLDERNI